MTFTPRVLGPLALVLLFACGGGSTGGGGGRDAGPDAALPDASADATIADAPALAGDAAVLGEGDASGELCGPVIVNGTLTVPVGETLTLCPGTDMRFAPGTKLRVDGTLVAEGTESDPIHFGQGSAWDGVRVSGTLTAAYFTIENASTCIQGVDGATVTVDHGRLEGCTAPAILSTGATMTRMEIIGGSTIGVTGGTLSMTDSLVDMGRIGQSPDCVIVTNGSLNLDHVRVTGCHCPLHLNSASTPVSVTNSILDGAAVPVMIRNASGNFAHNDLLGSQYDLEDIGGGIAVTLSDNYYGGGAATIDTGNLSQFTGAASFRTESVSGAGPRPEP